MSDTYPFFEVIVGNIGCVHKSKDLEAAIRTYIGYAKLSETGKGRAGNEIVTLFVNGEPRAEYEPWVGDAVDITMRLKVWMSGEEEDAKISWSQQELAIASQAMQLSLQEHVLKRQDWLQDVLNTAATKYRDLLLLASESGDDYSTYDAEKVWFDGRALEDEKQPSFEISLSHGPRFLAPDFKDAGLEQLRLEYGNIAAAEDDESNEDDSVDQDNHDTEA